MSCRKIHIDQGQSGGFVGNKKLDQSIGNKYIKIEQSGGYKSGFRLKKTVNEPRKRFERTFTQVYPDGSIGGKYVGYDYAKHEQNYRMQGTAWLSAVRKAYRENCLEWKEVHRLTRIMEDFGTDDIEEAQNIYSGLSKEDKKVYQTESAEMLCEPMEITLRETTPGNNKMNFMVRQKKYYVESIPIAPRAVSPRRVYRSVPKVYPMKPKESIDEFKARKGLDCC